MKSCITLSSFAGAVLAVSLLGCDTTPEPPQVRRPTEIRDSPHRLRPPTEIREFDWGFMKFAEVRAFLLNWERGGLVGGLIERGRLNRTRAPKDGIALDATQVEQLRKAITGYHEREFIPYSFYTHHAFAFLDSEGKIIGHLNIAFVGPHYWAVGSVEMEEHLHRPWDLEGIEKLIRELEMPLKNPRWNDKD